ncbi:MAG: sporulation integral membrane protein YtvI [Oscillospiraceae bacterium]|nr:sporulation integral membrane protein YtvI [Oscillospiraceae bacterium]
MANSSLKKPLVLLVAFAVLWLAVRYALPVALPFLLGAGLALLAEPLVGLTVRKLRFPRWLGAGLGVTAALAAVLGILSLLGAVVVRELGKLVHNLPDMESTVRQGMLLTQDFLVGVSENAPESVRPMLQRTVLNFFDDGSVLLQEVTGKIPGVVSTAVARVGDGAFGVGTGVLAAFFISARLPELKEKIKSKIPQRWQQEYLPAVKRVRKALSGWFKAQCKLLTVTYLIVTVGFLILGVPYGWAWAILVALVDAMPVLGTGTVLLPWTLVNVLRGKTLQAVGLFCIYGATVVTRSVLEPRLVGRQLGLDPLATLLALYLGYRFWGIPGMFLAPILASAAKSLANSSSLL